MSDVHKPYDDDGVTYCGWATESGVFDGCGELWPCSTVKPRTDVPMSTDEYRCGSCLQGLHEECSERCGCHPTEVQQAPSGAPDLMAALRASLERARKEREARR